MFCASLQGGIRRQCMEEGYRIDEKKIHLKGGGGEKNCAKIRGSVGG